MNLCLVWRFYLGLGSPGVRRRYGHLLVRAAAGRDPELVRSLVLAYRGEIADLPVRRINHRCAEVVASTERYFVKEFRRGHWGHDVERWLRLSRVDRAWRAAHLLPRFGVNTPAAVGTAQARESSGQITEYLVTEWLPAATPLPEAAASATAETREIIFQELARHLALLYRKGLYQRDLVKNILVTQSASGRGYWLTDLDGLHPVKLVTAGRRRRHLDQVEHYLGPEARERVGHAMPR